MYQDSIDRRTFRKLRRQAIEKGLKNQTGEDFAWSRFNFRYNRYYHGSM